MINMNYKEIFEKLKTIAVVGMSKNSYKIAYNVPMFFHISGFKVIPINPTTDNIGGLACYPNLDSVPDPIDIVNVFRPSDFAYDVIVQAVKRKTEKNDIKVIWLQEDIFSEKGKQLAEENGIIFIQDNCIYKEFVK
jgi:uncharacterized protein